MFIIALRECRDEALKSVKVCLSHAADEGKNGYGLDLWKELSACQASMSCCILLPGGTASLSKEQVMLDATDSILQSHRQT